MLLNKPEFAEAVRQHASGRSSICPASGGPGSWPLVPLSSLPRRYAGSGYSCVILRCATTYAGSALGGSDVHVIQGTQWHSIWSIGSCMLRQALTVHMRAARYFWLAGVLHMVG